MNICFWFICNKRLQCFSEKLLRTADGKLKKNHVRGSTAMSNSWLESQLAFDGLVIECLVALKNRIRGAVAVRFFLSREPRNDWSKIQQIMLTKRTKKKVLERDFYGRIEAGRFEDLWFWKSTKEFYLRFFRNFINSAFRFPCIKQISCFLQLISPPQIGGYGLRR